MIYVETNPEHSWIQGRNGLYDIIAIELTLVCNCEAVIIDGIGKSGKVINGGLQITAEAMDEVCRQWQKLRGDKDTILELVETLRELADIQSGPPLAQYEAEWNAAMKRAYALLNKLEE